MKQRTIKIISYSFSAAVSLIFLISVIAWMSSDHTKFSYDNKSFTHILIGISLGFFSIAIPLGGIILSIAKITKWVDEL